MGFHLELNDLHCCWPMMMRNLKFRGRERAGGFSFLGSIWSAYVGFVGCTSIARELDLNISLITYSCLTSQNRPFICKRFNNIIPGCTLSFLFYQRLLRIQVMQLVIVLCVCWGLGYATKSEHSLSVII